MIDKQIAKNRLQRESARRQLPESQRESPREILKYEAQKNHCRKPNATARVPEVDNQRNNVGKRWPDRELENDS